MVLRGDAPASVIDLGLRQHDVADPGRSPAPGDGPRSRPRQVRQRWAFAACLVLVLVLVGGAAATPPPSLSPIAPAPPAGVTGYAIAGDSLYLLTGGAGAQRPGGPGAPDAASRAEGPAAPDGARLSAYHLPDGRPRWSVPAAAGEWLAAREAGDAVLLLTQSPSCCTVAAYRASDGTAYWSKHGDLLGVDAADSLAVLVVDGATQVVESRSGRVRWDVDRSAVALLDGRQLLLLYPDGAVQRRALDTGATLATGRIPPPGTSLFTQAIVDGRLIVGYSADYQSGTVAAYDVATLAPLWTHSDQLIDRVDPCGGVVCLRTGFGLEGVDPATGTTRWRQADWYAIEQAGRLLAFTPVSGEIRAVGVVEPRTGRVLLDLRQWEILGDLQDQYFVVTRQVPGTGHTSVALADLSGLTLQVVGDDTGQLSDCHAAAATLACRTADGAFRLWAYHP